MSQRPRLRGLDFSSSPSRRKPCVLAEGRREGPLVEMTSLRELPTLTAYADMLREPGPWVGGFDLPFGLPRELVTHLAWPDSWPELMAHYSSLSRDEIRRCFAAFCAARPVGGKFAHRACDRPAGSSPSMKWINPPVAFMLHAGLPPLIEAGCDLPGLLAGDPSRVALEAYPGWLARQVLGRRSYKSDDVAKQTAEREQARAELVGRLENGDHPLALKLRLTSTLRDQVIADPRGDALDAVLCLMQAAWSLDQDRWGHPPEVDPLEGWILCAPHGQH